MSPQDSASLRERIERAIDICGVNARRTVVIDSILAAIESANREGAEPIYQLKLRDGDWRDQTEMSFSYNNRYGHTTRIVYAAPPDAAKDAQRIAETGALVRKQGRELGEQDNTIAELRQQLTTVTAERDAAVKALTEARDMVADWGAYASEYFQEKHDLAGDVAKLDAAIASSAKQANEIEPLGGIQP